MTSMQVTSGPEEASGSQSGSEAGPGGAAPGRAGKEPGQRDQAWGAELGRARAPGSRAPGSRLPAALRAPQAGADRTGANTCPAKGSLWHEAERGLRPEGSPGQCYIPAAPWPACCARVAPSTERLRKTRGRAAPPAERKREPHRTLLRLRRC
ncbi:hypothetical protein KIL84_018134 [Mauremys mutica]|uniref:Uncharacterized protein n=1 Tax=Mauremys mutica TaxID=74926 RepID=A0A9D4B9E6_9SAUR|nr:hypothetical protein KIL84_018134 [Mauremys mutica]